MGLAIPEKADAVSQVPRRAYGRGRKDERIAMKQLPGSMRELAERIGYGFVGAVVLALAIACLAHG